MSAGRHWGIKSQVFLKNTDDYMSAGKDNPYSSQWPQL